MAFSALQSRLPTRLQPYSWLLIPLAIMLLLLLVMSVVLPSFVNSKEVSTELTQRVEALTGRSFSHEGLSVRILPSPSITLRDVRLENIPGATRTFMLQAPRLEIPFSFGVLLGGEVSAEKLVVHDASLELETLSNGQDNWHFSTTAQEGGAQQSREIQLNNAQIIYTDKQDGYVETIQAVNGAVRLGGGRFAMKSRFRLRQQTSELRAECGSLKFSHLQSFQGKCDVRFAQGQDQLSFKGDVIRSAQGMAVNGEMDLSHHDIRGWLDMMYGGGQARFTDYFVKPIPVQSKARYFRSGSRLVFNASELSSGEANKGKGFIDIDLGEQKKSNIQLTMDALDLDALLGNSLTRGATSSLNLLALEDGFPSDLKGDIRLQAAKWLMGGVSGNDLRVSGAFKQGGLEVSLLQMGLPQQGRIASKGRLTMRKNGPRYDGRMDVNAKKLSFISPWLGQSAELPEEYDTALRARFIATLSHHDVKLGNLQMLLGESRITGGISAQPLASPTRLDTQLTIDQFDFSPLWAHWFGQASVYEAEQDLAFNPFKLEGFLARNQQETHRITVKKAHFFEHKDIAVNGQLEVQPKGEISLNDMSITTTEGTNFVANGSLTARDRQLPQVDLSLKAERLVLGDMFADYVLASEEEQQFAKANNQPLSQWSARAFNFNPFQYMDLRVKLEADEIEHDWLSAANVKLDVDAKERELLINDLSGRLWDGDWVVQSQLAFKQVPQLSVSFTAAGTEFEPLLDQLVSVDVLSGPVSLGAQLQSSGLSMADWMDRLRGPVNLQALASKLDGLNVAAILQKAPQTDSVNLRNVLSKAAFSGQTTLNSLEGVLYFDKGFMRFTNMAMQLDNAVAALDGTLRLNDYKLNAQMHLGLAGLAQRNQNPPTLGVKLQGVLPALQPALETQDVENFLSRNQ